MATPGDTKTGSNGFKYVFAANRTWVIDTSSASKATTADIEAGYFTMASAIPKLAFRDTSTDPYKALYGELFHPIRLSDREFLPNVVVIGVAAGAGAGGTDQLAYIPITDSITIDAPSHGFSGTLYIGKDGELTDVEPVDTFRVVVVGAVVDNDLIVLAPAESIEKKPRTHTFPATVWSNLKSTAYKSASIADGSVAIIRNNAVINASPNSSAMLLAINDPTNADDLRFSSANTGIEIEFETKAYVSEVVLKIARRLYWTGTTERATFDVLVYTNAADGSPAQTVKVWDTADGTVVFNGINTVVPVNQQCEKIKLEWAATTGTDVVQGSIQSIAVRGAKRKESIAITAGDARVPYDDWRLESPIIRRSDRIDTLERERSGIAIDTNLAYPTYLWGWGRSWNPGTVTENTVDRTLIDRRSYRDWVYDGNFGSYDDSFNWLSIDHESAEWQYHPADTVQQIADRDASWADTYQAVRALSPNQIAGPYLFPFTAFSALQGYFTGGGGVSHGYYANALTRENNAEKLYDMSDVMNPVCYRLNGESMEDWKANVGHKVDQCHLRGRLCLPYIWSMNSGTASYWGDADFREMVRFALETCDGVLFWEQITAFETTGGVPSGSSPYIPSVIEAICRIVREEVDRIQSAHDAEYQHLEITADNPDVTGYTSGETDGTGLTITNISGGTTDKLFTLEIKATDSIQASSGVIDFGAAGPSSPWSPANGGTMQLRLKDTGEWCRVLHQ